MKTQRQINRFVGKCKINLQIYFLVECKGNDKLQWEHCIDAKNGETIKQIKQFNELTKLEPLPYIHPDYKSYKQLLIKKCIQKHEQRMTLPQHSRKVQKIVGKARINNNLFVLVKWKDYPDSQASWVNSYKMWNFFRAPMKLFYQTTKNQQLPFVYEGFESQLSTVMNEEINSESESQNSKESKKLKKENKMKRFNTEKREQVGIEQKMRKQTEKQSDLINEEQFTKNFQEETKLVFNALIEKKLKKKEKLQTYHLTGETKVQDSSESFVTKVENSQTKKSLNSQINGALDRSQEMEIFNNAKDHKTKKVIKQSPKNQHLSQSIQIKLQCEDVPVEDSNKEVQNLYRVLIVTEKQSFQELNVKNIKKETRFLLTSQMLQSYPKQFVKYLETQIKLFSRLEN